MLDLKSLMGVLVWGDLALAFLAFGYLKYHSAIDDKRPSALSNKNIGSK